MATPAAMAADGSLQRLRLAVTAAGAYCVKQDSKFG
jgi:hypothetical protein